MEETTRKQINLLVHLAQADGQFHKSERKFIDDLLEKHGIQNFPYQESDYKTVMQEIETATAKEELIYLALTLIKVDNEIHPNEIAFCKALVVKLKFSPGLIDAYANAPLPELPQFINDIQTFRVG